MLSKRALGDLCAQVQQTGVISARTNGASRLFGDRTGQAPRFPANELCGKLGDGVRRAA